MSGWEPVDVWQTEQPMRCTVCSEIYVGRELGFAPNFCDHDRCPGTTDRVDVIVTPFVPTAGRQGGPDA